MVLAIGFLSFVAGSFLTFTGSFPANHLTDAFRGGQALLAQQTEYDTPFPSDFWQPARSEARGVTIYDPARAFDGFTLYTSGHAQSAFLISMSGEVVHEWHLPFSRIWDDSAAVAAPPPDAHMYIEKAHLLPNGDLLALYVAIGTSPWGMGLVAHGPRRRDRLEIPRAGPPRLRRRRRRPDLRVDPRDPRRRGARPPASEAAADRRLRRGALARGQGAAEGLAARRARGFALRHDAQHGPLVHRRGQGRLPAHQLDRRGDRRAGGAGAVRRGGPGPAVAARDRRGSAARPRARAGGMGLARALAAAARRRPAGRRPPAAVRQRGRHRRPLARARARSRPRRRSPGATPATPSIRSTAACARRRSGCPTATR